MITRDQYVAVIDELVEFEHLKNYNLPALRETGFEYLRNLYR